jgi:peptidoglycan glycosyltransferase
MDPNDGRVRKLMEAPRWIRVTVDAAVQMRLTRAFSNHLQRNGWKSGAIAVIRPGSGELLAAVSLPLPPTEPDTASDDTLDLARFGEYPPGSVFKLVTAMAALRLDPGLAGKRYECVRLPDGRAGNRVRGRVIRDDVQDRNPHGSVDLRSGIVHSCNAFFSQLGTYDVGAERLMSFAKSFNIETAHPNTAQALDADLPQAAYGQAQVLVTPLRMARVAGAIAAGGRLAALQTRSGGPARQEHRLLDASLAAMIDSAMRGVVTSGTGREAARSAVPIAGKTGTAELAHAPSHAWFAGYAPAGAPVDQRIAFAIVVANGRYGGRAAAPFAPQLIDAARELMQPPRRVPAEESQ